jgi:hypothetical protein
VSAQTSGRYYRGSQNLGSRYAKQIPKYGAVVPTEPALKPSHRAQARALAPVSYPLCYGEQCFGTSLRAFGVIAHYRRAFI